MFWGEFGKGMREIIFSPGIGFKEAEVNIVSLPEKSALENFVGGKKMAFGGREEKLVLIKKEIKTNFILDFLLTRAAAAAEKLKKRNSQKASKPEAARGSDDEPVNVVLGRGVLTGKSAGD